jgi:hypothetical protein
MISMQDGGSLNTHSQSTFMVSLPVTGAGDREGKEENSAVTGHRKFRTMRQVLRGLLFVLVFCWYWGLNSWPVFAK